MKTVGQSKPTAKFYDVKGVTGSDGDGVVHVGLVEADLLVDGMLVEVVEEGEAVLVGTGDEALFWPWPNKAKKSSVPLPWLLDGGVKERKGFGRRASSAAMPSVFVAAVFCGWFEPLRRRRGRTCRCGAEDI
jgi:hypothetical protein